MSKNNILIAEFMGYEEIVFPRNSMYLGQFTHPISKRVYEEDELDFDKDWNLLIPVIQKISGIVKKYDPLYNHKGLDQRLNPYTYDIESLHKAIVEFIKSYNYGNTN